MELQCQQQPACFKDEISNAIWNWVKLNLWTFSGQHFRGRCQSLEEKRVHLWPRFVSCDCFIFRCVEVSWDSWSEVIWINLKFWTVLQIINNFLKLLFCFFFIIIWQTLFKGLLYDRKTHFASLVCPYEFQTNLTAEHTKMVFEKEKTAYFWHVKESIHFHPILCYSLFKFFFQIILRKLSFSLLTELLLQLKTPYRSCNWTSECCNANIWCSIKLHDEFLILLMSLAKFYTKNRKFIKSSFQLSKG